MDSYYNVTQPNWSVAGDHSLDSNSSFDNATSSVITPTKDHAWLTDMRTITEVYIVLPLSILGIVGNMLSFVVLCRHKHRLSTTAMLQVLALVDSIVLLFTILLRSLRYVSFESYVENYHFIFVALYPSTYLIRLFASWLTVLLTFDRFIAVCYPLHAQRLCVLPRTYVNMLLLFGLSLLFSLVRYFEYEIVPPEKSKYQFLPTEIMSSVVYSVFYRIILFFIVMYLIPTILMIILNGRLLQTLKRAAAYRQNLQGSATPKQDRYSGSRNSNALTHASSNHVNRSITAIVATVVLVTITCNVAAMVSHVLYSLEKCFDSLSHLELYRRVASNISNIFVTINSAINFIIYCVCSRNFRSVFALTFGCKSKLRRNALSYSSDSKRRSTTFSSTNVSLIRSSSRRISADSHEQEHMLLTASHTHSLHK